MKIYAFGDYRLNAKNRKLFRQTGEVVPLTPRIFDLLLTLIKNNERVLTKDELLETVWVDCIVEESNLSQSIFILRKALGETAHNPRYIRTIPAQGYRFIAPVKIEDDNDFSDKDIFKKIPNENLKQNRKDFPPIKSNVFNKLWERKFLVGAFIGVALFLSAGFSLYYKSKSDRFTSHTEKKPSLAVLPFTNLKPGEDSDYLGYAFADTLNTKLTSMRAFRVFPSSVMVKYRNSQISFEQISRELNAEYIVAGTYLKESGQITVTSQVIDVAKNETLFQDSFLLNDDQLSLLQERIARRLITELRLRPDEMESFSNLSEINPRAYNFFLKGIEQYSRVQLEESIENLEKAVALEPNFAEAWDRLGTSYMVSAAIRFGGAEFYQKAEQSFQKSIDIDPNNNTPLIHLADMMIETNRKEKAVEILLKVLEKEPENGLAWWELSYAYRYAGMLEESIKAGEKAHKVDPGFFLRTAVPSYYLYTEQYEKFKNSLPQRTGSSYIKFYQGFAEYHLNNKEAAKQFFDEAYRIDSGSMQTQIGKTYSYLISGEKEKALNLLNKTKKEIVEKNVSDGEGTYKVAQAFAVLGESGSALEIFEMSVENGFFCYPYFLNDPLMSNIRNEKEFLEILQRAKHSYDSFVKN